MKPGVQRSMVLFPLAFLFMVVGADPLAIVCYVLLAAPYRLAGDTKKAAGVALWAAVLALAVMNSFVVALAYGAGAAMGIILALAIERQWSYGWQLTLAAGTSFATAALQMLVTWAEWRRDITVFFNARIAEFEALENVDTQWIAMFQWWDLNYDYVGLGSVFGSALLLSAYTLCTLERWQRDPATRARRKPTGFQRMRVPDWAVWLAIATALLWFAENRWPNPALRMITWNVAVGFTFIYWINGLSMLLYALNVFKATIFGKFMVFSGLFLFGLMPLLGIFGLFDTWYDFRTRFRRLAMLKHVSYRSDDQDL